MSPERGRLRFLHIPLPFWKLYDFSLDQDEYLATPAMAIHQKRARPLTPPPTPSDYMMNTDGLDATREAGGKRLRLEHPINDEMAQVHEHHRQHDRLERSSSGSGSGVTQLFSSSEHRKLVAEGAINQIREGGVGLQEQQTVRFNSSCADSTLSTPSQIPKEVCFFLR